MGISESGRLAFNPQENCLLDLFFDVRELFEKMAEEKGIKITASIHQAETVFADSEMLKTIMRNLISNAIKFTDRGGSIKIKANQVESNLMITISDNGVGMTSSNQKKLFDISQMHTTRGTLNEKGTGFGLLLCKNLVEKHDGTIWVESELGNGTDIKFTLPNKK